MIVYKEFDFHAAHRDADAPCGDQCSRIHGHTYTLIIGISGYMDNGRGMLIHGDAIKTFYSAMVEPLVEHQYLNDTLDFNPTMERLLHWIADEAALYFREHPAENISGIHVELKETKTLGAQTTRTLEEVPSDE